MTPGLGCPGTDAGSRERTHDARDQPTILEYMVDKRPQADRILVARLHGTAKHHARWRDLSEAEEAAAVAELGGRRLDGDAHDAQRPYVDPLAHTTATSDVGGDGFMNMSPVSTSGRPPSAQDIYCYGERTSSDRDNRTFGTYRRFFYLTFGLRHPGPARRCTSSGASGQWMGAFSSAAPGAASRRVWKARG